MPMRFGNLGPEPDDFGKLLDRVRRSTALSEQQAHRHACFGVVWPQPNRLGERKDGTVRLPQLHE